MTGDETVYLSKNRHGSSRKIYHTDRDCYRLRAAALVREKPIGVLPDEYCECKSCDGLCEGPGGAGSGHYKSLVAAAKANAGGAGDE